MSANLFCTYYDQQLQASLTHLINYPQYLPFIGNAWDSLKDRILFVGESHYLPKTSAGKSNSNTWYNGSAKDLTALDHQHIFTRGVIQDAETGKYNKAYRIFYNIKAVINEVNNIDTSKAPLFQNFAYYNYFQRPAEVTGASINNCVIDNHVAYTTIKIFTETLKPTVIIFVSKKAYMSFQAQKLKMQDEVFNSTAIYQVPHPACAWWHRKSRLNKRQNGKERFKEIIKNLDLKYD